MTAADAEAAYLGALLVNPELIPAVIPNGGLSARGDRIYRALSAVFSRTGTADILLVLDELGDREEAGYLAQAAAGVPKSANARHYLGIVEREARSTRAALAAQGLAEAIQEGDTPARIGEHLEAVQSALEEPRADEPLRGLDVAEILRTEPEPVPWLIPGWLGGGDLCILAGEAGSGKSVLGMHLALCLAAGLPFLGHLPIVRPVRVLYLDEEQNPRLARWRLRQLAVGLGLEGAPNLRYRVRNRVNLDRDDACRRVQREIEEFDPDIILADSLVRMHSRNENDNSEMSAWFAERLDPIRTWGRLEPRTCILYHHLAKPTKDRPAEQLAYRVRGASDLPGVVDALWGLEGDRADNRRRLRHEKCRWGECSSPMSLRWERSEDDASAVILGEPENLSAEQEIRRLIEVQVRATRAEIVGMLDSRGFSAADRLATKVLGKLKACGTLIAERNGRDMVYRPANEG